MSGSFDSNPGGIMQLTREVPAPRFKVSRKESAPQALVATPPKSAVLPALANPGFIRELAGIAVYGRRNERPPAAQM